MIKPELFNLVDQFLKQPNRKWHKWFHGTQASKITEYFKEDLEDYLKANTYEDYNVPTVIKDFLNSKFYRVKGWLNPKETGDKLMNEMYEDFCEFMESKRIH